MNSKLLLLLLIPSILLNIFFIKKNNDANKVVEVVDGDTFQLQSGQRIRLMGVDAPEYDRCGGSQAQEKLKRRSKGSLWQDSGLGVCWPKFY